MLSWRGSVDSRVGASLRATIATSQCMTEMDLLRLTLDKLSISGRWWARFERWHYGGEACDAILVVAAESVAAGRSE